MIAAPGIAGRPSEISTGGIQSQEFLAPLPDPLFHQPQIEAVFAHGQANEARMRTKRMMKQREHESLDKFAVLKKSSPLETAQVPHLRAKLPKHTNQATGVFAFLRLRQRVE
jgi:hypothetical protein